MMLLDPTRLASSSVKETLSVTLAAAAAISATSPETFAWTGAAGVASAGALVVSPTAADALAAGLDPEPPLSFNVVIAALNATLASVWEYFTSQPASRHLWHLPKLCGR